jgi:hypothetical protein
MRSMISTCTAQRYPHGPPLHELNVFSTREPLAQLQVNRVNSEGERNTNAFSGNEPHWRAVDTCKILQLRVLGVEV